MAFKYITDYTLLKVWSENCRKFAEFGFKKGGDLKAVFIIHQHLLVFKEKIRRVKNRLEKFMVLKVYVAADTI